MPHVAETKLSLDDFARFMGIHPIHFWGIQITQVASGDSTQRVYCDGAWMQHEWQNSDGVSREEVARAIQQAEDDIEAVLGYRLAPAWEVDEWQPGTRYFRPELVNLNSRDLRGLGQLTQARWGHFLSGGIRSQTLISEAAALTWSSTQAPTEWEDTGSLTVATTVTNAEEIALYYPGHSGDEAWRIRPIAVDLASTPGFAIITFKRQLAVLESTLEDLFSAAVEGVDDDNFLATVDVYRVYNDPQSQVSFLWESIPNCGTCGGAGCGSCQYTTQTGCLLIRGDPRLSMTVFHPADWNATELEFDAAAWAVGRTPDLARLYYYAGLRDKSLARPNTEMSRDWARTVAILAASRLDRAPCDCSAGWWNRWAADLAFKGGADETGIYDLSARDLDNPFGTRRGEVYAWRRVSRPGARVARSAQPVGG